MTRSEENKTYWDKNKDKINKNRRLLNSQKNKEQKRIDYERMRLWFLNNKEKQYTNVKRYRNKNRMICLNYYSENKLLCNCCGEKIVRFLCIDHINNDGAEHRKKNGIKDGSGIYSWIIKNNFPDGFQVLCYNCNMGKQHNNGICPHNDLSTGNGCK